LYSWSRGVFYILIILAVRIIPIKEVKLRFEKIRF
jgi:hypothetical protein